MGSLLIVRITDLLVEQIFKIRLRLYVQVQLPWHITDKTYLITIVEDDVIYIVRAHSLWTFHAMFHNAFLSGWHYQKQIIHNGQRIFDVIIACGMKVECSLTSRNGLTTGA